MATEFSRLIRSLDWDDDRWDTALTAVNISQRAVDGIRAAIASRLAEHGCPHHIVYWITSTTWDLRKLQALLQSDMVTDQLRAHSVAMRGGSLRYQAQNLRRVRIPV